MPMLTTSHTALILTTCLLLIASACTTAPKAADCPTPVETATTTSVVVGSLSPEQLAMLNAPGIERAKLYLDDQGKIIKVATYITKDQLPEWFIALADKELGMGADDSYELELYSEVGKVYEITRVINGLKVELSVRADNKRVYYIERELPEAELPEPIKAALAGAEVTRRALKTIGDAQQYHIRHMKNGQEHRTVFNAQGEPLLSQRLLPTVVEITPAP